MCISKYIYIYCCHYPQGIGLSIRLQRNRPDWPFDFSRMSRGRLLRVAGSQHNTSLQLDQEDNTNKARSGTGINPFLQNCVGGFTDDLPFFFFKSKITISTARTGRKQLLSRKVKKRTVGALKQGMNFNERDSNQLSEGVGEGRGGCSEDITRQGSKVTKRGLKSWDPVFKFPGPLYRAFPQEVYRNLKIASLSSPALHKNLGIFRYELTAHTLTGDRPLHPIGDT